MIRLNHVSKIYGDGSKKAVDDLSWDIEDGKITGFIGPNGAGKTTTLKMITGILAPSEGTIEINGKDIQKDPLEAKRQFGFVPDDPDAFLRVRGIEYLNFMADIYGVGTEERQRFIEETAKRFETYDFNMDHDTDIKPIAKSEAHFNKWIVNYPFYSNIHKEGVVLYGAA